jgi:hypothetical protein
VRGHIVPTYDDIINNSMTYKVAGGTANALTVALDLVPDSYAVCMIVRFKAIATNTGATTINVNGLGLKNIYKATGGTVSALTGGEIVTDGIYEVAYDGTQFQLLGGSSGAASNSGMDLLSIQTASASTFLDFDLDSDYESFLFDVNALKLSASSEVWLRCSIDGGSTFKSGVSDYTTQHSYLANTTEIFQRVQDSKIIISGTVVGSGMTGVSGQVSIHNAVAARWQNVRFNLGSISTTVASYNTIGHGMYFSAADGVNAVRFFPSIGNFSSGVIRCYGLRSSL